MPFCRYVEGSRCLGASVFWSDLTLRRYSLLYGSGTDAGWVRVYDAAALAAISAAPKIHKHRSETEGSPPSSSDSPQQQEQRSKLRAREEREIRFLHRCTCSECGFPPRFWFCLSPAGLTSRHKLALDHSGPAVAASALSSSSGTKNDPFFFYFFFLLYSSGDPAEDPDWLVGAMEPSSARSWSWTEKLLRPEADSSPAPSKRCLNRFKSAFFSCHYVIEVTNYYFKIEVLTSKVF